MAWHSFFLLASRNDRLFDDWHTRGAKARRRLSAIFSSSSPLQNPWKEETFVRQEKRRRSQNRARLLFAAKKKFVSEALKPFFRLSSPFFSLARFFFTWKEKIWRQKKGLLQSTYTVLPWLQQQPELDKRAIFALFIHFPPPLFPRCSHDEFFSSFFFSLSLTEFFRHFGLGVVRSGAIKRHREWNVRKTSMSVAASILLACHCGLWSNAIGTERHICLVLTRTKRWTEKKVFCVIANRLHLRKHITKQQLIWKEEERSSPWSIWELIQRSDRILVSTAQYFYLTDGVTVHFFSSARHT